MYSKSDIEKIKELILSKVNNAENIILFGSYAKGTANEDSDMDLIVLLNSAIDRKDKLKLLASVRRLLAKKGYNTDLMLKEKKDFLREINLPTLSRTIHAEGKYIWNRG